MPEKEVMTIACRECFEKGREFAPLRIIVFSGELIIHCEEHGVLFSQPYIGPDLQPDEDEEGEELLIELGE